MLRFRQFIEEDFNDEHYEKLHAKLVNHFVYSNKESEHIHNYTDGIGSVDLNGKLHRIAQNKFNGVETIPYHQLTPHEEKLHRGMKRVIKKHVTPVNLHMYRGIEGAEEMQATQHHAFTSGSIHPEQSFDFVSGLVSGSRHIWKIHIPKGSHAAYVAHHTDDYDFQKELVLHPGAKIQFHKKPTRSKDDKVVYHGRLIHDGIKKVG